MIKPFYFAQLTDLHLGEGLNPKKAEENLQWALDELECLSPKPSLVLVTGDLICAGKKSEFWEYCRLVKNCKLPLYALPSNHDLWGEAGTKAWLEIIGPLRQEVDTEGVRFLLWDDVQQQNNGKNWHAEIRKEQQEWMEQKLDEAGNKPIIVAQHSPPLYVNGDYRDMWRGSNADTLLDLLSQYKVLAIVTGHWHRNGEWLAKGIRIINTGALCGWQWNGIPPHYCFVVRPGYRLFHFDGKCLRSFWRDGSYWSTPAPSVQATLVRIGSSHTGGPRPQVKPIEIFAKTKLYARTYGIVTRVRYSIVKNNWRPMYCTFNGLWNEWEAEIDPDEFRSIGKYNCVVCAEGIKGERAYDAVPIQLGKRKLGITDGTTEAGPEEIFELFYPPE